MEAAANYVRQAFETGIRTACQLKGIKLAYKQDVADHKAQDLLTGLKKWPGTATVLKTDWDAALRRLELMKDVVMNPYSHLTPAHQIFHGRKSSMQAALQSRQEPVLSRKVIREALANAVMHRSYQDHSPIQIVRYATGSKSSTPAFH